MKHRLIALSAMWIAAAALAQAEPAPTAPADPAPVILNAPKQAPAEPYAGQKPAQPAAATPAAAPAPKPSPAMPPATTAQPAPSTGASTAVPTATAPAAEGAAAAAKAAASEAKPAVPDGPQVKPIAKDGAPAKETTTSTKSDAKDEIKKSGSNEAAAASSGESVPSVAKPEPPQPTLLVAIDLTKQKMKVTENGETKYTWSISSGRTGYITPRGTFRPVWMSKMWYSRKYDYAPMPHSIFFHGGTAIHGTDSVYALGRPASHGCVRLAPNHAATLYRMVTKHGKQMTRITVFGTPKQAPVAARDDGDRRMPQRSRRYQEEPWWAEDDDDYPPVPRRRMYSDRYYDRYERPRDNYPRRPRRYVRDYEYYDDY